jgi:hypothetical protein
MPMTKIYKRISKTGYRNVYPSNGNGDYKVIIKGKWVGSFSNLQEAVKVRDMVKEGKNVNVSRLNRDAYKKSLLLIAKDMRKRTKTARVIGKTQIEQWASLLERLVTEPKITYAYMSKKND